MKANELQIDNQYLYTMIAIASENEAISSFDFLTPKNDLNAAINEYNSMLNHLVEARKSFSKLNSKIPKPLDREYITLKHGIGKQLIEVKKRINDIAEVYEDVIEFATNIIKELNGIVIEEKNLKWEIVDSNNKNELLEMVYIRLIACTRLIGFCNHLNQELSTDLIEVKDIFANSDRQIGLIIENLRKIKSSLSSKIMQTKSALDKLTQYVVVDLTKIDDEYGRYEFNKWLHSWRNDIINWKLRAYRGIDKKDIVLVRNYRLLGINSLLHISTNEIFVSKLIKIFFY